MLDALKFVNRATANKSTIHAYTHICVHDGKIQGSDSKMAIECDCPELAGCEFTVPADKFIKAVSACDNQPKVTINAEGVVKVSYKRFRANMPSLNVADYPRTNFDDEHSQVVAAPENLGATLSALLPFISQDTSRPWSQGIWISDGYAYATNNVILVRSPIDWPHEAINIPEYAVRELTMINKTPVSLSISKNSIGVSYEGAWFKAQLYQNPWPQSVSGMFDKKAGEMIDVPAELLPSIEKLIPFCLDEKTKTIYFKGSEISTADGAQSAQVELDWDGVGAYQAGHLQLVLGVAKRWTPSAYPAAVFFEGENIEGVFVGVRQ